MGGVFAVYFVELVKRRAVTRPSVMAVLRCRQWMNAAEDGPAVPHQFCETIIACLAVETVG